MEVSQCAACFVCSWKVDHWHGVGRYMFMSVHAIVMGDMGDMVIGVSNINHSLNMRKRMPKHKRF